MSFNDLLVLLRILNESPCLTALHDEVMKLVLKQIKKELEGMN